VNGPQRCPECGRGVELIGAPGMPGTGAECTAADECGWAGPENETDTSPTGPAPLPPWQAARLEVLLDALDDVPMSEAERRSLTWLCGFEADTVENIAAVIRRARGGAQ